MNRPLFSVVTVTLNCAADAVRTAKGVLAQRFRDYEYIVKDGGSVDGTVELLRNMGVARMYVAPDGGVYMAMNQALAHCSGEYICFLNAGDFFASPHTLGTVAMWIRRHDCPPFAYGDVRSYARSAVLPTAPMALSPPREIQYRNRLSRFYLYRKMICHQAWYVRRSLYLKRDGFDEQYRVLSDYDFLLGIALEERVDYMHIPVVTVLFQRGGISEKNPRQVAEERSQIQRRFFSRAERLLYEILSDGIHTLSHQFPLRRIPSALPAAMRKRVNGW